MVRRISLFHCSAHGLRKAGASIAAENARQAMLKAIFGWTTSQQANLQPSCATKEACRRRREASFAGP